VLMQVFASSISRNFCFLAMSGLVLLTGCADQGEITTYRTEKQDDVYEDNHVEGSGRPERTAPPVAAPMAGGSDEAGEPQRMFAAMLIHGDVSWFYKLQGPADPIEEVVPQVTEFIESVEHEGRTAEWELPEGWKEQPGGSFRYATILIPTEDQTLEMSVSMLNTQDDVNQYAADNINRWRGQLGLDPLKVDEIELAGDDATQELWKNTLEDGEIFYVNLVGETQAGGMRPPFAR